MERPVTPADRVLALLNARAKAVVSQPGVAPSLFDPPDPPTGPSTDIEKFARSATLGYDGWRETPDGHAVYAFVEGRALALAASGAARISTRDLCAEARLVSRIEVNNVFTPAMADELVRRHPALLPLVERRRRRVAPSAG